MAEPQLSIRSARARDTAYRLAKREKRSLARIVERALDLYERQTETPEDARAFYARMSRDYGVDVDLEAIIRQDRKERAHDDAL